MADFALSWRGWYDDVVRGYDEAHPLSEFDWHLLVPAFWAWLFLGVKERIEQSSPAQLRHEGFAWQVKQFQRRSELFGDLAASIPGEYPTP